LSGDGPRRERELTGVNALTDKDNIDLVTGMMRYSGVPVTVHPIGESLVASPPRQFTQTTPTLRGAGISSG